MDRFLKSYGTTISIETAAYFLGASVSRMKRIIDENCFDWAIVTSSITTKRRRWQIATVGFFKWLIANDDCDKNIDFLYNMVEIDIERNRLRRERERERKSRRMSTRMLNES